MVSDIIQDVVMNGAGSLIDLIKSAVTFIMNHKGILFFAAGAVLGYPVGLFFGEDAAEEDVVNYLSGKMKIE